MFSLQFFASHNTETFIITILMDFPTMSEETVKIKQEKITPEREDTKEDVEKLLDSKEEIEPSK